MVFLVRDPWRVQFFRDVACPEGVTIAIDDLDCWEFFPSLRHIYDKLHVARSQGLACGTRAEIPDHFPVFAKPRVNLGGMGARSFVVLDARAFRAEMTGEHMWMERLEGPHVSTDCAVVNGKVAWQRQTTGAVWTGGTFKHWCLELKDDAGLARRLSEWIAQELPHYTGMINIETIGGKIIEAQLRFADQWCDLYGGGWLDAVVGLYARGQWIFDDSERRPGWSIPLFAGHGHVPRMPSADVQDSIRAMPGVSSLQLTFHEHKRWDEHTMPPGGFRLGIINAFDFQAGLEAREALARAFPDCVVMLPETGGPVTGASS